MTEQLELEEQQTESLDFEQADSSTLTTIAIVEADERAFQLQQRRASALAASTLVPKQYQGRDNVPNVMIAMNMAKRMDADVLQVMQNLYVVHGKPAWSAQFLIGTFNACGRFSAIRYQFNEEQTECTASTTELATGELITGTKITTKMAEAEGWTSKSGSKWKTMPEQMLRYRAATFLIRSVAPEIGLGLYTKEEMDDVGER